MNDFADRFKGVIYGQAIGDALGLGTEFMNDEEMARNYPDGITHYSDIFQDRHRKRWKAGDWTDDTDMMLCIADAVIKDRGVNLRTIAQNFKDWADSGPMGIGNLTHNVLTIRDYVERPQAVAKLAWKMSQQKAAANGGVMRTSVVGLFPKAVDLCAENICKLTHYDPRCVGSCVIVSELIHTLVYDEPELSYDEIVGIGRDYDVRIEEYVGLAQSDNIGALNLQDEHAMGYTLKTLAAALWAYWHAYSFEDGLLRVVRAGGDADTNAAVACAVLGAKFGCSTIPTEYVDGLVRKQKLDKVIEGLLDVLAPKVQ